MDEYMQTIRNIMFTLSGVKAEGPDNWNRLSAVYQALGDMLEKMNEEGQDVAE